MPRAFERGSRPTAVALAFPDAQSPTPAACPHCADRSAHSECSTRSDGGGALRSSPTTPRGGIAMSAEENKALARRWLEAVDTGDVAVVQQFIAPDYVD